MAVKTHTFVYPLLWGLGALGILQLGSLEIDASHALCGAWGCAPPLAPMASMHLLWLWVLLPFSVILIGSCSGRQRLIIGCSLVILSLLFTSGLVLCDFLQHSERQPELYRRYAPQRALFLLATNSDYPFVQILLLGVVWTITGWRRRAASNAPPPSRESKL